MIIKVLNVVHDQIKSHMLALAQTQTVSLPVSKKAVCGRQKQMTKKKQKWWLKNWKWDEKDFKSV